MTATVQLTPLYERHLQSNAKFVDFHGWQLPVQYTSVLQEHQAVRAAAGLFDISHMGQVIVTGPKAFDFLQSLITNDLTRLKEKSLGVYAHLLRPDGGVIDDIFIYGHPARNEYFIVANGATRGKDVAWLRQNATGGVSIMDLMGRGGMAIQGPKALEIVRRTLAGVAELPRFAFQKVQGPAPEEALWACRTGYTGEDGAEFFGPARTIATLWKQLLENGADLGLLPCGLGARDTLRLEMGYPLYGQELTEDRSPLEAAMEWVVKWTKGNFIGRAALETRKRLGVKEQLLAYELEGRGVPRPGTPVFQQGEAGGTTTSGTFSPSLRKGIGLAYAPVSWNNVGASLEVEIHNKRVPAKVVSLPFYRKKGT